MLGGKQPNTIEALGVAGLDTLLPELIPELDKALQASAVVGQQSGLQAGTIDLAASMNASTLIQDLATALGGSSTAGATGPPGLQQLIETLAHPAAEVSTAPANPSISVLKSSLLGAAGASILACYAELISASSST